LKIQLKLKQILEKNTGLSLLKKMSHILLGIRDIEELDSFPDDVILVVMFHSSSSPLSLSVNVERSFSKYKTFLTNNRRSFKF
jgi:hypothetical protein